MAMSKFTNQANQFVEFVQQFHFHFHSEVIEFWLVGWRVGLNVKLKSDSFFSCSYKLHLQPLELEDRIDPEQVGSGGVHVLHVHIHRDLRPL